MRSQFPWLAMLISSSLFSCSSNPSPDPTPPDPGKMPLTIQGGIASYTKASNAGFDDLDEVGIYVVNYQDADTPGNLSTGGNHATNVKHRYHADNNGWNAESGDEIYWKDETTKADIYGYYPYSTTISSVSALPFSVQTDQSTVKNGITLGGYEASDFLWVKKSEVAPQTTPVSLAFGHIMSKAVITLVAGEGFDELPMDGITVRIVGTKPASTIHLETGTVTVDESAAISPITAWKDGVTYKAIVVPQTIPAGTSFIKIEIGDETYTHVSGYTFEPGKQHNLTITLKRPTSVVKTELSSNNITAWVEDQNTHQGDAELCLSERAALMAFYHALDGENWEDNTNWCSDQPLGTWFGVTTDAEGHVTELMLLNNRLTGPFPKEIKFLKHLQRLSIGQSWNSTVVPTTGLSGTIPKEIGELRELTTLSISGHLSLTGNIPPEIGKLTKLEGLSLPYNNLTGNLPAEIRNLTRLKYISLQCNALTGELPDEIRYLTNLETLTIDRYTNDTRNHIMLPEAIGELTNLTTLHIVGNGLTSLPEEMGKLVNLQTLWLRYNDLTGSLPVWIGNLTNLRDFNIEGNKLTGDIPDAVKNHPWWNMWNPHSTIYPQQDGYGFSFPGENARDRTALMALYNALEWNGKSYWNWGSDQPLALWYGVMTDENGVTDIPYMNDVQGSLPEEIWNLTNLTTLQLVGDFTGTIPNDIGNLTHLKRLYLDGNLSGTIPASIGNLVNLEELDLRENLLTGSIPENITSLTKLKSLSLYNNNLTGNIPVGIGNLPSISRIHLSGNRLSGEIPSDIKNHSYMGSYYKSWIAPQQDGYGFTNVD